MIKLDAEGCLVLDASTDRAIAVPASPPERVVDVTGAGDAFCGGFLAGLACGLDPVLAAAYGALSARSTIGTLGALSAGEVSADVLPDALEQLLVGARILGERGATAKLGTRSVEWN